LAGTLLHQSAILQNPKFPAKRLSGMVPRKAFIWQINADLKTETGLAAIELASYLSVTNTAIQVRPGSARLTGFGNKFSLMFCLWTRDEQIQKAFAETLGRDCIRLKAYSNQPNICTARKAD
jgi:hypothetical protein